jgi:hypothetical protein
MDGKCVLRCIENYEKIKNENDNEYICEPKTCVDRRPWNNKSCSVKEDFLSSSSANACYFMKTADGDGGKCVAEGQCEERNVGVLFIYLLLRLGIFREGMIH